MNGSARLSLPEILAALTEIAQTGSGSERLKALSLLARQEGPTPTVIELPDPLTDAEVVERLARLFAGVRDELIRSAYQRTHPKGRRDIGAPVQAVDLPREIQDKADKVRTVRQLYALIPALKRPGRPSGYPVGAGPLERQEWCQRRAAECLLEQMNASPKGL